MCNLEYNCNATKNKEYYSKITIDPEEELVRMRAFGTGGSLRSAGIVLLLKCVARSSMFSRSNTACCNFNSLIAVISSNFCVSKEERVILS